MREQYEYAVQCEDNERIALNVAVNNLQFLSPDPDRLTLLPIQLSNNISPDSRSRKSGLSPKRLGRFELVEAT